MDLRFSVKGISCPVTAVHNGEGKTRAKVRNSETCDSIGYMFLCEAEWNPEIYGSVLEALFIRLIHH